MSRNIPSLLLSLITVGGCVACGASTERDIANNHAELLPAAEKIAEFDVGADISALAISPDGEGIAARTPNTPDLYLCSRKNAQCKVWTTSAGESSGDIPKSALRYSPNGRYLALIHDLEATQPADFWGGSVVHVWSTESAEVVQIIGDSQHGSTLPSLDFSPDSALLLRLFRINPQIPSDQVVAFSTNDWHPVWSLRTLPFHPDALALSADGKLLALGGSVFGPDVRQPETQIWLIDARTREIKRKIVGLPAQVTVEAISWSPDGNHIAVGLSIFSNSIPPENLKVFDVRTGVLVASTKTADELLFAVKYAGDGQYLIEDGLSGMVTIWEPSLKRVVQQINPGRGLTLARGPLALSPDRHLLAIAAGSRITVWTIR